MPISSKLNRFLELTRERPRRAFRLISALARGTWYVVYFRAFRRDVRIGFPFLAFGRVSITGPGRVRLGSGCSAVASVFRGLSIVTLSPAAEVVIGKKCALGGLIVRCRQRVTFGDGVMTASALVQDVLFSDLEAAARTGPHALESAPVTIDANAWLGLSSVVLCGTRLGEDDVLAAGALCRGIGVDRYAFVSGNPAGRSLPIPQMLAMRDRS